MEHCRRRPAGPAGSEWTPPDARRAGLLHGRPRGAAPGRARVPERVAALVLESGSPGLPDADERRRAASPTRRWPSASSATAWPRSSTRGSGCPCSPASRRCRPSRGWRCGDSGCTTGRIGLANSLRGMGTGAQVSLWERLGAITCPNTASSRGIRIQVSPYRAGDGAGAAALATWRSCAKPATPSTWSGRTSSTAWWRPLQGHTCANRPIQIFLCRGDASYVERMADRPHVRGHQV